MYNPHNNPHPVESVLLTANVVLWPILLVVLLPTLIVVGVALLPIVLVVGGLWLVGLVVGDLLSPRQAAPEQNLDPTWQPTWKKYGSRPVTYEEL